MSGSGLLEAQVPVRRTAAAERADVLALLDRKIAQGETVAAKDPGFAEHHAACRRQLEVIRDEIAAGLHEGEDS